MPDVAVVLDDRLDPADGTGSRVGAVTDQPVPAVDERQPFLGDAVLQHAGPPRSARPARSAPPRPPPGCARPCPGRAPACGRRPCWPSRAGSASSAELTSTGNGSESAKCSHGSPSGKDMTSGNRENDRNAANDSPAGCSSRSSVRPLCTWPSSSVLDLARPPPAAPHRRRRADRRAVPISVCRNSQATSSRGGVPGGQGAGAPARGRAARPGRSTGPISPCADRLVVEAQRLLAGPVER